MSLPSASLEICSRSSSSISDDMMMTRFIVFECEQRIVWNKVLSYCSERRRRQSRSSVSPAAAIVVAEETILELNNNASSLRARALQIDDWARQKAVIQLLTRFDLLLNWFCFIIYHQGIIYQRKREDDVATSVDRRLLSNYTSIIIAYSVLSLKVLHTHTKKNVLFIWN